jgi:DNA-binding NtrC family response regulator
VSSTSLKILVVDDNRSAADALARVLSKKGNQVETAYDGQTAITLLQTSPPPDVVLTDLKMEPVDGMAVLRAARACRPPLEVIVFTAYGAVDIAVDAMRLGARDFLTKPVTVEQVELRLKQIRPDHLHPAPTTQVIPSFIANSPSSTQLLHAIRQAAEVPSPVLVEGEIGSGRGFVAQTIHQMNKSDEPFRVWDIGRDTDWPSSGTVLLPNIDDLPDDLQRELVRNLHHVPQEVRLIATAGPDGRRNVAEGNLRPELYFSLAVVVVDVPPLRERPQDIMPLLNQAILHFSKEFGRPTPEIYAHQRDHLEQHAWPGNVREVINLGERAVVMGNNAFNIDIVNAPKTDLPNIDAGFNLATYLEGIEQKILEETLMRTHGDRNQTGKLLGVERNTLRYKLKKYGLLDV